MFLDTDTMTMPRKTANWHHMPRGDRIEPWRLSMPSCGDCAKLRGFASTQQVCSLNIRPTF